MSLSVILLIAFVVGILIFLFIALFVLISWLKSMQHSLDATSSTVNDSLTRSTKDIYDRLTHATDVIGELKKEAGAFAEVSRSMKDLQDFLKSPKLRGNIGESVLNDLLSQIFPKSNYSLQYSFKSGEKVDAVIKTDAGLLPIDSKFAMENYQKMAAADNKIDKEVFTRAFARDLKKHFSDISTKYILPGEGTLDFALMYIPSESVYYELARDADLMDYARSLRVYPVSPNTMYATLQTILLSFEGKKIESRAKEVFTLLRSLSRDYEKTSAHLATLGSHLTNAYNKYSEVETSMGQIGQKLDTTKMLSDQNDK